MRITSRLSPDTCEDVRGVACKDGTEQIYLSGRYSQGVYCGDNDTSLTWDIPERFHIIE